MKKFQTLDRVEQLRHVSTFWMHNHENITFLQVDIMQKSFFTPMYVIQPKIVHNVCDSITTSKRSCLLLPKNEWITFKGTKSACNCGRSTSAIAVWRATNHWKKNDLWRLHLFGAYYYSNDGKSSCAWMLVKLIFLTKTCFYTLAISLRYSETLLCNSLDVVDYSLDWNDLFVGLTWTLHYRRISRLLRNHKTVLDLSYFI